MQHLQQVRSQSSSCDPKIGEQERSKTRKVIHIRMLRMMSIFYPGNSALNDKCVFSDEGQTKILIAIFFSLLSHSRSVSICWVCSPVLVACLLPRITRIQCALPSRPSFSRVPLPFMALETALFPTNYYDKPQQVLDENATAGKKQHQLTHYHSAPLLPPAHPQQRHPFRPPTQTMWCQY